MKMAKKLMVIALCITGGILWAQAGAAPPVWTTQPEVKDKENPQKKYFVGASVEFHTSERGARNAAELDALNKWARFCESKIISGLGTLEGSDSDDEGVVDFLKSKGAMGILARASGRGVKALEYYVETRKDSQGKTRYKVFVLMEVDKGTVSQEFDSWAKNTADTVKRSAPKEWDPAWVKTVEDFLAGGMGITTDSIDFSEINE